MALTLEELNIKFTASMSGLTTQLNGVKRQLDGVAATANTTQNAFAGLAKAAKMFLGVFVVRAVYQVGKSSLAMANEVVESENLFEESMRGMAGAAREWSDGLRDSLGLNAYALRKNVGVFNVMFRSMGMGTAKAYEMSTVLTELAEDMASFYNLPSEEAFTKLSAGIMGETMPLRRLGILVDENTTKQYAYANGIAKVGAELTQQQKLLARYGSILAQTTTAQGDLARTLDSPVNQIRLLNNTLDQARVALGQAFQPIQAIVIPILNAIARAALFAANAIRTFLWALTGFSNVSIGAAASAEKGADANERLAGSMNDTAKAMKGGGRAAKMAAKDIKQAAKDANVGLKAFDEINKIAADTADSMNEAAGGKGGDAGGGLGEKPEIVQNELYAQALESVNQAMSKAADWLKKVWELALPTREALVRLWESLKAFGDVVWDGIVDFYDKFLKPIGTWAVTSALPAFLDVLTASVELVTQVLESAKPAWDEFYNRVLVPIGNWAGGKIVEALQWLKGALDAITAWIRENPETFERIITPLLYIAGGFVAIWAASTLISAVKRTFDILHGAIAIFTTPKGAIALLIAGLVYLIANWDDVKAAAVRAWKGIENAWNTAATWFDENVAQPIKGFFSDAWGKVLIFARTTWDNVAAAWNTAATWFDENVAQPIKGFFSDAWGSVLLFARTTWNLVSSAWMDASKWFYDNVTAPVLKFFNDAFGSILRAARSAWTWVQDAWSGAKEWFADVLKPVEDAINAIGDMWETIKGWFSKKITQEVEVVYSSSGNPYSGRGGSLNGEEPTTNTETKIPGFASGGVFRPNSPLLAVLGDQKSGMNIETPEALLRDIFKQEFAAGVAGISSARPTFSPMDTGGLSSNLVQQAVEAVLDRLNIQLYVDGEQFGRVAVRTINDTQRRAGQYLLGMG